MSDINFDKFVEDIEKRRKEAEEKKKQQSNAEKNWPVRRIAEKYRENPGDRTTWSK